jgi:hypothetical protein
MLKPCNASNRKRWRIVFQHLEKTTLDDHFEAAAMNEKKIIHLKDEDTETTEN